MTQIAPMAAVNRTPMLCGFRSAICAIWEICVGLLLEVVASGNGSAEVAQAAREEPPLGLLLREGQGARVRRDRVVGSAEAATQIRARGVREDIVGQEPAIENVVDEREAGRGAVPHRD